MELLQKISKNWIVILGIALTSTGFACDVATDLKILGFNAKTHSLFLQTTNSYEEDTESEPKWTSQPPVVMEYSLTSHKLEKKTVVSKTDYKKISIHYLKHNDRRFEWPKKHGQLVLALIPVGPDADTGSYSLSLKSKNKETPIAQSLANSSLGATEMSNPEAAFVLDTSLVILFKGCGEIQAWSAPLSRIH